MAQQPMTPAGVALKLEELYALGNPPLLAQANLVRSDFKSWVNSNFSLSPDQQTFLNGVDDRFISYAASQSGFAIENRLPITITLPDTPQPPASKFIRAESLLVGNSTMSDFEASGSLKFVIGTI